MRRYDTLSLPSETCIPQHLLLSLPTAWNNGIPTISTPAHRHLEHAKLIQTKRSSVFSSRIVHLRIYPLSVRRYPAVEFPALSKPHSQPFFRTHRYGRISIAVQLHALGWKSALTLETTKYRGYNQYQSFAIQEGRLENDAA